jgi:hypothetical protein
LHDDQQRTHPGKGQLSVAHLVQLRGDAEGPTRVKGLPIVSDATMADVIDCLRRLVQAPGHAGEIGQRLWDAVGTGQLEVRAHAFFCAPLPYHEMTDDLREELGACAVTIMKGDLNYRRLIGDQLWDATTPYADRSLESAAVEESAPAANCHQNCAAS